MLNLCVQCWLAKVFCIGASLELSVCIESKPYSLELSYNHIYMNKWKHKKYVSL